MPELSEAAGAIAGQARLATPADVPALVALGRQFIATTRYRDLVAENLPQMAHLASQLVHGADSAVLVLDGLDGPVGMLGLIAYAHHITGQRVAGEVFYFVDPGARGRGGLTLLRAAEDWAWAKGAASLEMIAPDARVGAFYERLGYAPVERTYLRRLEDR